VYEVRTHTAAGARPGGKTTGSQRRHFVAAGWWPRKRRTHVDITRVPYRSNPAGMTDLIGGQIDIMMPDLNTGKPHVLSGKARALAMFGKTRSPALPDVPTLDETILPGFDLQPWGGLSGPAHLPDEVVSTLQRSVHEALLLPATQDLFRTSGIDIFWADRKEFTIYVRDQLANWTGLIKEAGIPPE
jgi:tripartite-type tricarboxylate transporter receptor subunit TctC